MAVQERLMRPGLFEVDPPRLLGSRCEHCGRSHFPQKSACPDCHGVDVVIERLPTSGWVRTFTVVRNAPSPFPQPYALAYVQLEGTDLQVLTQLVGIDLDKLSIGMPVILRPQPVRMDEEGRHVIAHTFVPRPTGKS